MAYTFSRMFPLGAKAPSFSLLNALDGTTLTLDDVVGDKATVVMFISNHCPYVQHIKSKLSEVATKYQSKDIGFVAIASNDVDNFPEDGPEYMKKDAEKFAYPFPYLYDESQKVAKEYMAACTPDFYVFNADLKCAYRGRFDASNHKNGIAPTGEDLILAIEALINGTAVPTDQQPSGGCNIKWKPGVNPF